MKEFDYYIFIDYSENLIGYNIIEAAKIKELLPKISKFAHYRDLRHKKEYINSIKNKIEREEILSYFIKCKIKQLSKNMEIYTEVLQFIKQHENCIIFISVDNRQFDAFKKLVDIIENRKVIVKKESELAEETPEYRISLVLDTLLNIERNKNK